MADVSFYFVNGASNLTINSTSDYRLMGYDGIETTDIEFTGANNAMSDGGYKQSIRVPMRRITVNGMVSGSTVETLRAAVITFFKPNVLYTLAVTRNSITRNIYCYLVAGVRFTQSNINLPVYFDVELICPDPYFSATSATTVAAAAHSATITNPGDVPCGFVATLTATGGAVITPYIEDPTTVIVYIIYSGTASNTDVVTISTVPGDKYVKFEGTITYSYSASSLFGLLPVGNLTITDSAVTGGAYLVASYSFYPLYLGV